MESSDKPWSCVAAILKTPGRVADDLAQEKNLSRRTACALATTLAFCAIYGATVGFFEPGQQTMFAAAKLPVIVLVTGLLCTPALYVLHAILGSSLTLRQTFTLVLLLASAVSILLAAFAPIAWMFALSTGRPGFLRLLHLGFFGIALAFAMRIGGVLRDRINSSKEGVETIHGSLLYAWAALAVFVGLQLTWVLRPLVVPGPLFCGERSLFFENPAELFR